MSETLPPRSTILLWSWNLDTDRLSGAAAETLLSCDEVARARRLASQRLRDRFVSGRARLRSLLAAQLGLEPRSLAFVLNDFGKPRLDLAGFDPSPPLHFSLSHSEDRAILAVSDTVEIGCDIERVRSLDHLGLARRNFHPNEVAAIEEQATPEAQRLAFFGIWTLKEAVVKAMGAGLSVPLDSFEVSIAESPPVMVSSPEGTPPVWWLDLLQGSYCRALAAPGGGEFGLIQRMV